MSRGRPNLLDLLAGDLTGYRREETATGAVFTPSGSGQPLDVSLKVERRFLGRTEVARFNMSAASVLPGSARIRLRHTGVRRREGLSAVVSAGDEAAHRLADAIAGDPALAEAARPLDFKRFELELAEGEWRVGVELVGAALVAIALPPMRSYIRLYPDQREALTATFDELARVLGHGPEGTHRDQ